MKYRSVVATRRGGPEVLQIVENDLHPPAAGEVRVKVLAASITLPDVEARYGRSPFPPKTPFTPSSAWWMRLVLASPLGRLGIGPRY